MAQFQMAIFPTDIDNEINRLAVLQASIDTTMASNDNVHVPSTAAARAFFVAQTVTVNGHALSSNVVVTKADISLGNVTNNAQVVDPGSNGIVVRTGATTAVARSLTQPAAGMTITNADGTAGSPTFALANTLAALQTIGTAGAGDVLKNTGVDTWTLIKTFGSINIQIFTASGTYTPSAGMVYCLMGSVAGGGGGGGTANVSTVNAFGSGGGGGGGSTSIKFASAATVGASQTVTVGATAAGGAAGNNAGTNGNDTSIGAICIGKGGTGGGGGAGGSGAAGGGGNGGVSGTGDIKVLGQNGQPGAIILAAAGASSFALTIAIGGASGLGFGFGGLSSISTVTGGAGTGFGGGGAGGSSASNGGAAAGGAGASGLAFVIEFIKP